MRAPRTRHVAGDADASAAQPRWGPDDALCFAWEPEGAWNLWRDAGGETSCVHRSPAELAGPMWLLGARTWDFVDERTVLAAAVERGLARIVRIDVCCGVSEVVVEGPRTIGQPVGGPGRALAVEGWDGRGTAIRSVGRDGRIEDVADTGLSALLPAPYWSEPEPISFPTSEGDVAHGLFYEPRHPDFVLDGLPPLVWCRSTAVPSARRSPRATSGSNSGPLAGSRCST